MKRLAVFCVALALVLFAYILWLQPRRSELPVQTTPREPSSKQSAVARAAPRPFTSRPTTTTTAPALPKHAWHPSLDDIPDALHIEQTHEGFLDAYRTSVMLNPKLSRLLTRCLIRVPTNVGKVSIRVAETFRSRSDRTAELTEVVAAAEPDIPDYAECVRSAYMEAEFELPLPDSITDKHLQVRDEAVFHIAQDLTEEGARGILSELRERLDNPSLPDDERPILEQSLALYSCYLERGLEHRRECLAE